MSSAGRRGAGILIVVAVLAVGLLALTPFGLARLVADLWVGVMSVVMGLIGGIWGR